MPNWKTEAPMLLIKNGTIIDPAAGTMQKGDILAAGGEIISIEDAITPEDAAAAASAAGADATEALTVIDAAGLCVAPGLIGWTRARRRFGPS